MNFDDEHLYYVDQSKTDKLNCNHDNERLTLSIIQAYAKPNAASLFARSKLLLS